MKYHRTKSDKVFRGIMFFSMGLFSASFIFIMLWMLINSFRTAVDFSSSPFDLFQISKYTFENYITGFTIKIGREETTMIGMTINSIILTLITTLLAITIPAIVGYVTAKYKFMLKRWIVNIVIGTMVVPSIGVLSSTYSFITKIGLYDSFMGIFIMSAGGFGLGFLLFYNFFGSIPWEYAESGFIDGASNMQVFCKIMYPQAKGIVISIAIMAFISSWNDYFTPYMFLPSHPTVALGVDFIYQTMAQVGRNYPAVFAVMVFTTGVVLLIYSFFSKTIMESMSVGGLKG